MTPIFNPDFTAVESSIPVYDKIRARLHVTKAKPVIKEVKDDKGNVTNQMFVQFNLEMKGVYDDSGILQTEGWSGKTVSPFKGYLHTEGGWKFTKGFLLAAAGYDSKEEQKANEEFFQKHTWIVNGEAGAPPENIELGDGYPLCVDRLVEVTLIKKVDKARDGSDKEFENQEFKSWAPVKG